MASPGNVVHGKLIVKIKAPIAATVSASGKGLRRTRHTNAKPGTFKLAIPLKPGAIRVLAEKHQVGRHGPPALLAGDRHPVTPTDLTLNEWVPTRPGLTATR